jgi:hypothetical protein
MRDEVYEVEARKLLQTFFLERRPPTLYSHFPSQLLCQVDSTQVCAERLPASCIFDGAAPNVVDQSLLQSAVAWGSVPKQLQN